MIQAGDIAVAVLAGGQGSRIGGGKPFIRLGNKTLIERAVDRARHWNDRSVVVVRQSGQLGSLEMPFITDIPGIEGPLAGLAAGLQWARGLGSKALLSLPCDMPFPPEDLPSRLSEGLGANGAALASSGGRLHPVCGLWRVEAMDGMGTYCATGQRSLRGFAEHIGFAEVSWHTEPIDPFFNINTLDDRQKAELMLAD